jgi:hydrogenase maturation protease
MPNNSMLILGVGNPFRRDDGIGPAIIARLRAEGALQGVDLVDGGVDGLTLIDTVQGYARVVIVDAVNMGAAPGEFRLFTPQDAVLSVSSDALSTHGFGLAEVVALMEKLDMRVNMQILGIQAKDVSFGEGLSPELDCRIDTMLEVLHQIISDHSPQGVTPPQGATPPREK